jgi:hypothetical protein
MAVIGDQSSGVRPITSASVIRLGRDTSQEEIAGTTAQVEWAKSIRSVDAVTLVRRVLAQLDVSMILYCGL